MKRIMLIAVLVFLISSGCGIKDKTEQQNDKMITASEQNVIDPVVNFQSDVFKALISEALSLQGEDIHQSDLDSITGMTVIDWETIAINFEAESMMHIKNISHYESVFDEHVLDETDISLEDLQYFPKLETLCLISCNVESWEGMRYLNNLCSLELNYYDDFDLSSLSSVLFKMINLQTLDLRYNNIDDISVLSGLEIESLVLYGNHIQGIDLEKPMKNLKKLDIGCNDFAMVNIKSEDFPLLEVLSFADTNLRLEFKIDTLAQFDSLTELSLSDCRIRDVSALASLTKLTYLDLFGSHIVDITPLSNMKELEYLNLRFNNTLDISPGTYLIDEVVIDLTPIKNLTKLKELDISENAGKLDISSFGTLKKLEVFTCSGGSVYGCDALCNSTRLRELVLRDTKGTYDLAFLKGMGNLKYIDISCGEFKDITALASLNNLDYLDIRYNPIEDYSVLDQLDLDELHK